MRLVCGWASDWNHDCEYELGAAFRSIRRSASTWPNFLVFFIFVSIFISETMLSWADFTGHCLLWMLHQRLCSESNWSSFFRMKTDWVASLWVKYLKASVVHILHVGLQTQSHVVYRALLFGTNLRGKSEATKSTLSYLPSQENGLNLQPCKYLPACMLRWMSASGNTAEVYTPFLIPVHHGTIWGRHGFVRELKRCQEVFLWVAYHKYAPNVCHTLKVQELIFFPFFTCTNNMEVM